MNPEVKRDTRFFEPDDAPVGERNPISFLTHLDSLVLKKEGEKGTPGEVTRLVQQGLSTLGAVAFDISTGQQVAYGLLGFVRYNGVKPVLTTAITVSSYYSRRGYATLLRQHLTSYIAHDCPKGIEMDEAILANNSEDVRTVTNILKRGGARSIESGTYPKFIQQIGHHPSPVSVSLTGFDTAFSGKMKTLPTAENLDWKGRVALYKGTAIARMERGQIIIPREYGINPDIWEGVNELWKASLSVGLKPKFLL